MKSDALGRQRRQDDFVQQRVLLGDQRMGFPVDAAEDLLRRQAVGVGGMAAQLDLLLEAGDADLEELVEVGGDDAQEAQAFQQRHALVGGLREDAAVEGEQRQFPVDESARGEAVGGSDQA